MFGNFQWNGFIDDNPQDFANSAIELYQETSWLGAQLKGVAIIIGFQKNYFH
jgi:hypothetical protein